MIGVVKYGFLGFRKLKLRFDLRALKAATVAARLDLGEFLSDDKINDHDRMFYETYGAWLYGKEINRQSLLRFRKIYNRLSVNKLNEIRLLRMKGNIISTNLINSIKEAAKVNEKKN